MHTPRGISHTGRRVVAAGAMLMATSVATGAPERPANDWHFAAVIYGWLPSIDGDLRYAPRGSDGTFSVDANRILDNLQFTFMGSFEARKGPWSGFTDVIYLNLSGDKLLQDVEFGGLKLGVAFRF
jgi:hypothetical protein